MFGGGRGDRTHDLMLAKHALSQLSYAPSIIFTYGSTNRMVGLGQINDPHLQSMVGLGGLEPPTSRLSGVRSNRAELQTQ